MGVGFLTSDRVACPSCKRGPESAEADVFTDSTNTLAWIDGRVGDNINDKKAVSHLLTAVYRLREKVKLKLTWIPRKNNVAGIFMERNP